MSVHMVLLHGVQAWYCVCIAALTHETDSTAIYVHYMTHCTICVCRLLVKYHYAFEEALIYVCSFRELGQCLSATFHGLKP